MGNILEYDLTSIRSAALQLTAKDRASLVRSISHSLEKDIDGLGIGCIYHGRTPMSVTRKAEKRQACFSRAKELLVAVAGITGFSQEYIRFGGRNMCRLRYIIAYVLSGEHHNEEDIGAFFHLHHTTICLGIKRIQEISLTPVYDPATYKIYRQLTDIIFPRNEELP